MQTLLSNKAFENRDAVLRPFSARDAEAEGIRVGRALGMQSHALSTQRSILQREFVFLIGQHLSGIPFRFSSVMDAFNFCLALSGAKPASEIAYMGPKDLFLSPTSIRIGKYPPIYVKACRAYKETLELVISRDRSLIEKQEHFLNIRAIQGGLFEEQLLVQGLAFGYPKSAAEAYASFPGGIEQVSNYECLLLENNISMIPPLWNAPYVPTISAGKAVEADHLIFWNTVLAKELPQFAFTIGSAHNKFRKIELLVARSHGMASWNEEDRDRVIREAIERAYGVPLPLGY